MFAAVDPAVESLQEPYAEQPWALQVGYYAEQQNALNFQQRLMDAGYPAQIIVGGRPGAERYRVIAGWADAPEEFTELQNALEDAVGERGFALRNPYLTAPPQVAEQEGDPFAQSTPDLLLAQAEESRPMGGQSVASEVRESRSLNNLKTPQDEIDSMPGFTAAGLQIVPTLGLSLGYDDNVTRSSTDEIDSVFYVISPAIRVELPSDHSVLALTAAADIYRYSDSPIDDREPWYLRGAWAWDPSTRQDLNVYAQYGEGSDRRGTGRRQGDAGLVELALDDWKRFDYGGLWRYGAVGARGRLDLRAGGTSLEYTNNREFTEEFDRDWWFGGATFYWRIAPKTSALADFQYTEIDYTVADNDSEETSWMLGLAWEATARTSGRIAYGNLKKEFTNPDRDDYDGPTWLAAISWRPRTYSSFTLTGTRSTLEPDGNADYVLRQDLSLAWQHDWATRFSTVVDVGYGEDDYRPEVRTDKIFYWSVGARYRFNPHFRFGASMQGYDRSSDVEEYDYQRYVYMLTLEASF